MRERGNEAIDHRKTYVFLGVSPMEDLFLEWISRLCLA